MKISSIVDSNVKTIQKNQFYAPGWSLLVFLIVAMIVLKSFIYIKDVKRHGK